MTYCLKRKNKKRFFSFQSMPNFNFAELIVPIKKSIETSLISTISGISMLSRIPL